MAIGEVRLNDIGTVIELTIKDENDSAVDISGASTKQYIFRKPGGSALVKTADFVTDGTDGKLKYTTASGDLNTAGDWQVQAFVDFGATEWRSDIKNFMVHPNLPTS